jgi:hypothetical protein
MAESMSEKQLKDFAKTKRGQTAREKEKLREICEGGIRPQKIGQQDRPKGYEIKRALARLLQRQVALSALGDSSERGPPINPV